MSRQKAKRRCWRCGTRVWRTQLRRVVGGWECVSHDSCLRRLADSLKDAA